MVHRYATFIKTINLTGDYLVLNMSMLVAYYYLAGNVHFSWLPNKTYLPIVLIFNIAWFIAARITQLYNEVLNKDSVNTFRNVIKTYLTFICLISAILIIISIKTYFITREYLIYSSVLFGIFIGLWKLIFLSIRKSDRAILYDTRRVVIVGYGKSSIDLYYYFGLNPDRGYNMVGFFADDRESVKEQHLYMGKVDDCIDYVLANKIDEIFCTLPVSETEKIEKLITSADKNLIRFKIIPEYYDYGIKPVLIQSFGHIPVISVRSEPLENMLNRFIKRVFDIFFSIIIILLLLTWLFPILAILIRLESKGPVLFKQLRSGRDNSPFWCYKFRSMYIDNSNEEKQAVKNDQRITKIGTFLRRTSIDELPQFFNVLMGNMTVVGPRPHMLSHTTQYAQLIDRFMVRHFLKPGITGYAQVKGLRGETRTTEAMLKRVEADVWYLENWSFLLDLKIIFLTVWNSIRGDENAF
ncbi:undecaprenyl-phosphate glucose phosphotransferase [Mucilaginibacter segetis]|uniref:Undecaprenyl-phosphate glucose phosphotransferase n=1 Tax=Mucilaginibacter segetis TaxID=2793071 RepID=A0A934PTR2_9SPHI|nr:undecaprenyl-phosphate glucose phosphotransferase [Mucilaginibacter segetis]MBK0380674.1 undecaprenyl-phosphate glucose phosphotransferase [Mucilaginibacter segetis]